MQFHLLDTNALVWFLTGTRGRNGQLRLNRDTQELLLDRSAHIIVTTATFEDLRTKFNSSLGKGACSIVPALPVFEIARRAKNVYIYPFDEAVLNEVLRLEHLRTGINCPNDRQILATFLVLIKVLAVHQHEVTYIGSDRKILHYLRGQGLEACIRRCD